MTTPLIIEAAVNGSTKKSRNPHTPITPDELNADILACLEAGAAVIHNHIEDYSLTGEAAAKRYLQGWTEVVKQRPDAILCATATSHEDIVERQKHNEILAESGQMRMGVLDPGSMNFGDSNAEGLPGKRTFVYRNSFEDIDYINALLKRVRLGPSIAIYEPGFLRIVLALQKAGKLAPGSMVKLYFGGEANFVDFGSFSFFGLPPTRKAFEAYVEMLEGSGLTWCVAVPGGDVTASGLSKLAIERGGHVRVGLEDHHSPTRTPSNVELIREVVDLAKAAGRPIADCKTACRMMGMPR